MNLITITIFLTTVLIVNARPAEEEAVEIEKQRLIKFPEDPQKFQNSQKTDETKRILEEIKKININFGYIKNQNEPQIHPKQPIILNSEQYLFPKPSYHPVHNNYNHDFNYNSLPYPASIRNLKEPDLRGTVQQISRNIFPSDFSQRSIRPFLSIPVYQAPRNFQESGVYILEDLPKQSQRYAEKESVIDNIYKIKLSEEMENLIKDLPNDNRAILSKNGLPIIFLPAKITTIDEINDEIRQRQRNSGRLSDKQRLNDKIKEISLQKASLPQNYNTAPNFLQPSKVIPPQRVQNQLVQATKTNNKPLTVKLDSEKGSFGFFNRPALLNPSPAPFTSPTTIKHTTVNKIDIVDKNLQLPHRDIEEYDSNEQIEEEVKDSESEKGLFTPGHKAEKEKTQQEAIREGGVIIQRLKVRKGGIAIAGPGGVATAGSGGTAIVGPGGLALTHPRSLTIAGPGARIFAFPETYDLGEVALKAKPSGSSIARNFIPEGGKLVATGPIIYYHNPDDV